MGGQERTKKRNKFEISIYLFPKKKIKQLKKIHILNKSMWNIQSESELVFLVDVPVSERVITVLIKHTRAVGRRGHMQLRAMGAGEREGGLWNGGEQSTKKYYIGIRQRSPYPDVDLTQQWNRGILHSHICHV